jgi:transcriptional regulator with XRE-family HTH domain
MTMALGGKLTAAVVTDTSGRRVFSCSRQLEACVYLKQLRQQRLLSQEQVAEKSGLSLRTVQRAESGHRVGYASLRALAVVFDLDVDRLEQELYSMDKLKCDLFDLPIVASILFGKGNWKGSTKDKAEKIERFFFIAFLVCFIVWFSNFALNLPVLSKEMVPRIGNLGNLIGVVGLFQLLAAYFSSYYIRVGDKYDLWSRLEPIQPTGLFAWF